MEIVRIEKPENSYAALEEMVAHHKIYFGRFRIAFQDFEDYVEVIQVLAAMTYDFEVWSAASRKMVRSFFGF